MKRLLIFCVLFFCYVNTNCLSQIPYGDNPDSGKYISLNGVKHYYETYGNGKPLLLIHGNSTGIKGWAKVIEYFSKKYKVYAIDCRGGGKSELGKDSLTYMQMANDLSQFIKLMNIDSVSIIGKSDGGIVGILMGIYFPDKISKIVSFGANMSPDSTALYPQSVESIHNDRLNAEKMISLNDTSKNWFLEKQKLRLMEFQPNITANDLHKIKVPVLVMSCDRDLIKEEHSLFIYKNIPFAHLSILNGETHFIGKQNPELFNITADKFLSVPYKDNSVRYINN
jgi:pimeloyl-ACP methyl ester carboxylesterase